MTITQKQANARNLLEDFYGVHLKYLHIKIRKKTPRFFLNFQNLFQKKCYGCTKTNFNN